MASKPHIVIVIPRGEAVRNFLYSDTLAVLSQDARVTLLSVINDQIFNDRFGGLAEQVISLPQYQEKWPVRYLRDLVHQAHFRWLWSEVAKNKWETDDRTASGLPAKTRRLVKKMGIYAIANRPALEALTRLENVATVALRPDDHFIELFEQLKPDLVFNGSHIHGMAGELPMKIAHHMGIPTAGFIFSWDNLTSRSRIFVSYDHVLVWHEYMRNQFIDLYPRFPADHVHVTGTPQFDFHFKPEFWLTREQLCAQIGVDPDRQLILYTTGIDKHFPEEHHTVKLVIDLLKDMEPRPQLIVRMYVKGVSNEMNALAAQHHPDVFFPPMLWDDQWFVPHYDDLAFYTSLIREVSLGINAASTVSLELMMHGKPVINLNFDPPGSQLPSYLHYSRHINFDHYRPVADSGGVMVANSAEDMGRMLARGLSEPNADQEKQRIFIEKMFGDTLDGGAGERVAKQLLSLV